MALILEDTDLSAAGITQADRQLAKIRFTAADDHVHSVLVIGFFQFLRREFLQQTVHVSGPFKTGSYPVLCHGEKLYDTRPVQAFCRRS